MFASLACVTLAVGVGFAMTGAWLVLPFSGLEVLLLGAAFVMHTRDIARALETRASQIQG